MKTRRSLLSAAALCLLGFCLAVYLYNFHCVVPREVYRSAQLSSFSLNMLSHFTQLKTIVNLRGSHPDAHWYQQEQRYAKQHGIQLVDISLNATHLPTQHDLQIVTDTLLHAPKPILVHCQGGADRTGLVSAMALLLRQSTVHDARSQFSWQYYAFKKDAVGEQVLSRYEHWLSLHHWSHSPSHFISWVERTDGYAASI